MRYFKVYENQFLKQNILIEINMISRSDEMNLYIFFKIDCCTILYMKCLNIQAPRNKGTVLISPSLQKILSP